MTVLRINAISSSISPSAPLLPSLLHLNASHFFQARCRIYLFLHTVTVASLDTISYSFYVVLMFAAGVPRALAPFSGETHPGLHFLASPPWPNALGLPRLHWQSENSRHFPTLPWTRRFNPLMCFAGTSDQLTASTELRCTKVVTLKCAVVCRWLFGAEPTLKGVLPGLRHKHHTYFFPFQKEYFSYL